MASLIQAFNHFPNHRNKEAYTDAIPPSLSECYQLNAFFGTWWSGQFNSLLSDGNPLEIFKFSYLSGFSSANMVIPLLGNKSSRIRLLWSLEHPILCQQMNSPPNSSHWNIVPTTLEWQIPATVLRYTMTIKSSSSGPLQLLQNILGTWTSRITWFVNAISPKMWKCISYLESSTQVKFSLKRWRTMLIIAFYAILWWFTSRISSNTITMFLLKLSLKRNSLPAIIVRQKETSLKNWKKLGVS